MHMSAESTEYSCDTTIHFRIHHTIHFTIYLTYEYCTITVFAKGISQGGEACASAGAACKEEAQAQVGGTCRIIR